MGTWPSLDKLAVWPCKARRQQLARIRSFLKVRTCKIYYDREGRKRCVRASFCRGCVCTFWHAFMPCLHPMARFDTPWHALRLVAQTFDLRSNIQQNLVSEFLGFQIGEAHAWPRWLRFSHAPAEPVASDGGLEFHDQGDDSSDSGLESLLH